ncbi:hypothetical protein [Glycomyces xiaoerkulensis]|uniref:hypothetical protein n=1 Tax=Glycomyces xiaoerkulensis TaxID=2038139 RepID=UPI000C2612D3|nr:hypothetical protein [Glycomyces xiaoerkulensis]
MASIERSGGNTRRLGVPRLLLGAVFAVFGFLLLGAFGTATAWASDETAEAQGLAAVTDSLTAEVLDPSRLAARLVPQDQQGHEASADEGSAPGLVSGLTETAGSLVEEPVESVSDVLRSEASSGDANGKSSEDSADGVVTPLLGTLVDDASAVAHDPADAVSGVYETVAPVTDEVDVVARLVTDGLATTSDATPPGGVLADGRGQASFTALQPDTVPVEVAAALARVHNDRSAADLERSAAETGAAEADPIAPDRMRSPIADAEQPEPADGLALQHLSVIPGGAAGSTAGISVDGGKSAVDVSPCTADEQVSLDCAVIGELGRPVDRAAELSVAPD